MRWVKDFFGRDKEPAMPEISSHWAPTKESAEKLILIQIECALNKSRAELNDRTLFEDTILYKNASNSFRIFPHLERTPIFKHYQKMLPLNEREFTYKSVYSKTGGILNMFNPRIKEGMDNELKVLFDRYKDRKEAISTWKDIQSELWSSLSPKLVWAGGGDIEVQLLANFLTQLTNRMEGKGFDTEGHCVIESLKFLREWQLRPNKVCFGEIPADAIIEKRQKIYERKVSFLQEMQIETDFVNWTSDNS